MKVTTEKNCVDIVPGSRERITICIGDEEIYWREGNVTVSKSGVDVEIYRPNSTDEEKSAKLSVVIDTSELEFDDDSVPPPINVWLNNDQVLNNGQDVKDTGPETLYEAKLWPPSSKVYTNFVRHGDVIAKWLVFECDSEGIRKTLGGHLLLGQKSRSRLRTAHTHSLTFPSEAAKRVRPLAADECLYWLSLDNNVVVLFVGKAGQSWTSDPFQPQPALSLFFDAIYLPSEGELSVVKRSETWATH